MSEGGRGVKKCPFFRVPTGIGKIILELLMHFGPVRIKHFLSLTLPNVEQANYVLSPSLVTAQPDAAAAEAAAATEKVI